MKTCSSCEKLKDEIDFYRCKSNKDGLQYACKDCQAINSDNYKAKNPDRVSLNRRRILLRSYGLSLEEYDRLLVDQNGLCKICKGTQNNYSRTQKLFVDHDHVTGKVRGLLCHDCNYALGGFKDSTDLLKEAIAYLEKSGSK